MGVSYSIFDSDVNFIIDSSAKFDNDVKDNGALQKGDDR
jgi:hypothetical protein